MTFFGKPTFPYPGDLFVCSAGGAVGAAVRIGQLLDGDPVRELAWLLRGKPNPAPGVRPPWQYEHAGVFVGGKTIVQATPAGTERHQIKDWQLGRKYVLWSTGLFDLTGAQRQEIVAAANLIADKKIGYSWADYLALAVHRLHLPVPGLRDYIEDSGHMICSQEDDWEYQQGGVQIFTNGRWNGYVTPADLAGNFIGRARALHLI